MVADEALFRSHVALRDLARTLREQLSRNQIDGFGRLLHESWLLKRELAGGIATPEIDRWYARAIEAGAEGGKLLGAGGGGFLLFYSEAKADLRAAMARLGLPEVRFSFDYEGSALVVV